jgi:hypothetical protein
VSGTTCVPMPAVVKVSSSIEWARRPSTMCARSTPASTACRQAFILGIMPDCRLGRSSRSWEAEREEMRELRSGQAA